MNMKTKVLIVSLILCFGFIFADTIDFSTWTIKISNKTELTQQTNPQNDPSTQAKSLMKNLLFDADQTVEDYLTQNGKLMRQFERMNLISKQIDSRFLSDGSMINEYELPITGSLMKLLIPGTGGGVPLATLCCPTCKRPWPEDMPVPEGVKLIPLENEFTPKYTGVLIDARDITLNPCLFLKITTDEGQDAFGLSFADSSYVASQGLVAYVNSMSDAYKSDRLGINPLRITALKSTGTNKTDIIISAASAKMIHNSQHNLEVLEHCQVVIVVGE
jgi:hypothetical protein